MTNYESYYKYLVSNIEELAENPERLSVPELLDELSDLVIYNKNLMLNEEIEVVFKYQLDRVNALFNTNSLAVALFELNSIFKFDSKLQFIIGFKYDDDVLRFLDKNFEKLNYIMNYLQNKINSIISDKTSDDLSDDEINEIEEIKASDEDNDGE